MKFVLKASLERFVLVKIVAALWNQNDVRDLMRKFYLEFSSSELCQFFGDRVVEKAGWQFLEDRVIKKVKWQEIEDKIIEKVQQLPVPELLIEEIEGCIRPVGLQIFKLMAYYRDGLFLKNLPVELYWTPEGIIDRKRTAKKFIENESFHIDLRFKLACIFCLENSILELGKKTSGNCRESFSYIDIVNRRESFPCPNVGIYNFWRDKLQGNSYLNNNESSSNQLLFESNALQGNKPTTEYFFSKLTPSEREESLIKIAKNVTDTHVLCFLLSEMNEEQQIQVFKNNPFKVLRCFLYWPFQNFFIEAAGHMWSFLPTWDYRRLLLNIVSNIKLGYKDCHYKVLFKKFWQKSPSSLKRYIVDDDDNYLPLLQSLLETKDKVNFKLIIQDMSFVKKKKIIDWNLMENICECWFYEGDWDFFEFIIQKFLPLESEMKEFKEIFERKRNIRSYLGLADNKEKWDQLFLFHDESVCKYTKRKCVADKSEGKRLYRIE